MKQAKGLLSVSVWLDCPECNVQLDLMDVDELNEEGGMWGVIGDFIESKPKHPKIVFDCPNCKKAVHFTELEY